MLAVLAAVATVVPVVPLSRCPVVDNRRSDFTRANRRAAKREDFAADAGGRDCAGEFQESCARLVDHRSAGGSGEIEIPVGGAAGADLGERGRDRAGADGDQTVRRAGGDANGTVARADGTDGIDRQGAAADKGSPDVGVVVVGEGEGAGSTFGEINLLPGSADDGVRESEVRGSGGDADDGVAGESPEGHAAVGGGAAAAVAEGSARHHEVGRSIGSRPKGARHPPVGETIDGEGAGGDRGHAVVSVGTGESESARA